MSNETDDYTTLLEVLVNSGIDFDLFEGTIEVPLDIAPRAQRGRVVFTFNTETYRLTELWVIEEEI